jgi:hypothetical protein
MDSDLMKHGGSGTLELRWMDMSWWRRVDGCEECVGKRPEDGDRPTCFYIIAAGMLLT